MIFFSYGLGIMSPNHCREVEVRRRFDENRGVFVVFL